MSCDGCLNDPSDRRECKPLQLMGALGGPRPESEMNGVGVAAVNDLAGDVLGLPSNLIGYHWTAAHLRLPR